jgi:hypothetical protein
MGVSALHRRPTVGPTTRIDDLRVPAAEILALSPDAWKIDVLVPADHPTHRIIQIADVHYFPRDDFRNNRHPPSDEAYSEYASKVEELHETELRLLCWLVDNHGLNEVFREGLWEEAVPTAYQYLNALRHWSDSRAEVIADAARLRSDIDDAEVQGKDSAALRTRLRQAEVYAEWGLSNGSVLRLVAARPSVRLLPAEDADVAHVRLRGVGMEVREVAIVRNLLAQSKCAVVVLGTLHDLSEHVKQLGGGRCEYVRAVTVHGPGSSEGAGW